MFPRLALEPCRTLICLMVKFPLNYSFLNISLFLYVWLFLLANVYVHHVSTWCPWGPEEDKYPGFELQITVSSHMGAEN